MPPPLKATMDQTLLPDLYAILRGSVNHQAHLAFKAADGIWHLPPMLSPEYPLGACTRFVTEMCTCFTFLPASVVAAG
jgi:hypothetical protein